MLLLIKIQNFPQRKKKLQIYIKWTTKFKTLTVSIKYACLFLTVSLGIFCAHVCRLRLGNLILTKLYRAPRWLVSLSNKSNRAIAPEPTCSLHRIRLTRGEINWGEQIRVNTIHQHSTDKKPKGFTDTKYFPVHTDYNTMIKIKELNTYE